MKRALGSLWRVAVALVGIGVIAVLAVGVVAMATSCRSTLHGLRFLSNKLGLTEETPPSPLSEADAPDTPLAAAAGQMRTHTVKAGEDLYVVAIRWGVSPADLKWLNNLPSTELKEGMVLNIPDGGTLPPPAVANAEPPSAEHTPDTPLAPAAGQMRTHTVKAGEDLYSVAIQWGVSPNDLLKLNNLRTREDVREGMILKLPSGIR
ncbi:MAG: LysM peptidoglycan-binding domain-containing protein [Kiritimatiellaeota bacterium]|nr:LysM peptidoglycan-binding domain-containing protein [Kiritimatiellota bacterium]